MNLIPEEIKEAYDLGKEKYTFKTLKKGHINSSYIVHDIETNKSVYFLQKVNQNVFPHAENIMRNMVQVLDIFEAEKIDRFQSLKLIKTRSGSSSLLDKNGELWRMFHFLDSFVTIDQVLNAENCYEMGRGIAQFNQILRPENPSKFHTIIPNFHNVKTRLAALDSTIKLDKKNRLKEVIPLVKVVEKLRKSSLIIQENLDLGHLPIHICHNDTKSSNIMIRPDDKTLCMIDLDTVMPGSILFDFGDAARSIISYSSEDELSQENPDLNWSLFVPFMNGFVDYSESFTSALEKQLLKQSCMLLPFLMGIRFLTDFLEGDVYFSTDFPGQNKNRAMNQLYLSRSIEKYI